MTVLVMVGISSDTSLQRKDCLPAPPEAKSWSVERSAEPKKVAKRKGKDVVHLGVPPAY